MDITSSILIVSFIGAIIFSLIYFIYDFNKIAKNSVAKKAEVIEHFNYDRYIRKFENGSGFIGRVNNSGNYALVRVLDTNEEEMCYFNIIVNEKILPIGTIIDVSYYKDDNRTVIKCKL